MFQLARIHPHGAEEAGAQLGHEPDICSDQALDQALQISDQGIDVDRAGLQRFLTSKAQELTGEQCSPIGSLPDLLHVSTTTILLRKVPEEQLAESSNGGEQIIEIVRDPAREPGRRHPSAALGEAGLHYVAGQPGFGSVR